MPHSPRAIQVRVTSEIPSGGFIETLRVQEKGVPLLHRGRTSGLANAPEILPRKLARSLETPSFLPCSIRHSGQSAARKSPVQVQLCVVRMQALLFEYRASKREKTVKNGS